MLTTALALHCNSLKHVSAEEIIQQNFSSTQVTVEKSKIILNSDELSQMRTLSQQPLKSKIYRYYKVTSKKRLLGYAILIAQKVRTKKATVMYLVKPDSKIGFIEILSFLEPPEYIPNKEWIDQLKDRGATDRLKVGSDISTITGATLSAISITKGARVAIALYGLKIR